MAHQPTAGPTWTRPREIASVIDYDFYRERARRLREEAVAGGVRDFVYRTISRFCETPSSRAPAEPECS
ncbi:MAG: hypothetical protein R3268_02615 [Acidiferrobacterales bacterium]|nr:hypothetical protein [Acidiferrobacterales bacterium]